MLNPVVVYSLSDVSNFAMSTCNLYYTHDVIPTHLLRSTTTSANNLFLLHQKAYFWDDLKSHTYSERYDNLQYKSSVL